MTTAPPSLPSLATGLDPAAGRILHGYLAALAARLPGPARARHAVLAELADGLAEATHAHAAGGGVRPTAAAHAAVAEFGEPTTVAAAFAPELVGAQARRAALALVRTGPLVGGLWLAALAASHAAPWQAGLTLTGVWLGVPVIAAAVVAAGLAALLAVAATGRVSRWLPDHPTMAPTAAAVVGTAAVAVDVTVLGMLVGQAISTRGMVAWAPVALAATASLTRMVLAARTARRSLAARAALA